jgi:histidinol dehydrogenase
LTLMIKILSATNEAALRRLLEPRGPGDPLSRRRVRTIVNAVRRGGDPALKRYAQELDGLKESLEVSASEIRAEADRVSADLRAAIARAAKHIRIVARRQMPKPWRVRVASGVLVGQRVIPLDRVGCYVPSGRYPLPSSLLMTAIPARVAGVLEVVAVCAHPGPAICAAAAEAGVSRLFRIGGAQAVAALAYGTETVPRVDKIVGPGNRYVSLAKTLVSSDCAIDFHAGPTEVVIVSDAMPPLWIAADLVAQAEHDPDARAVFITTNRRLAVEVARELARRVAWAGSAREALARNGAIVVTRSLDDAVALANRLAPEHVACDDERTARKLRCAGTVFVGGMSVPAAGDYSTGSNHVLPTAGAARFRGGLSAADFVRMVSTQRLTKKGLERLAPDIVTLARAEGLEAHAASVEARFK